MNPTSRSVEESAHSLREQFRAKFGQSPQVYAAPGRVNLIGEHTDYNDGFVMPAAIGFSTTVTVTPRADRVVAVFSHNFSETAEFDLDDLNPKPARHWSDYVRGVAVTLERAGHRLNGATLR